MGGAICFTARITELKKNSHHLSNFKEHSQLYICSESWRKLHLMAVIYRNIVFFLLLLNQCSLIGVLAYIVITYQQPV